MAERLPQKDLDYQTLCDALDVLCRFCLEANPEYCAQCQLNLIIKKFYDKFNPDLKKRMEAPWNGVKTEWFGED